MVLLIHKNFRVTTFHDPNIEMIASATIPFFIYFSHHRVGERSRVSNVEKITEKLEKQKKTGMPLKSFSFHLVVDENGKNEHFFDFAMSRTKTKAKTHRKTGRKNRAR